MMMLIPSVVSIALLKYLERYNVRYTKISQIELKKNPLRDGICGVGSAVLILCILSVFAVIFVVPLVQEWPYQINFTLEHFQAVFNDQSLFGVYQNSIFVAFCTALLGLLVTYGAALATARSGLNGRLKGVIDAIALVTNTIPGMVIGIAFMFIFSGTALQNTFFLIILCNVVHFFSTPYLMMRNSLSKLNSSWETTASLMGDTWIKTIVRIVTPNMTSTILEVFSYYFVNAMVTAVYEGETTDEANSSANPKTFPEPLTLDLTPGENQSLLPNALRLDAAGEWHFWNGEPETEQEADQKDRLRIEGVYQKMQEGAGQQTAEQQKGERIPALQPHFKDAAFHFPLQRACAVSQSSGAVSPEKITDQKQHDALRGISPVKGGQAGARAQKEGDEKRTYENSGVRKKTGPVLQAFLQIQPDFLKYGI